MINFNLLNIKITNFACYYSDNVLDFTHKGDNNIFLFKLPNGFGKTSLFHAIKWGFYGESVEYYKDSDRIDVKSFLNDRLDPSKDIFSVEINFKHGSNNYMLRRTFKPSLKKYSTFTLSKDGEIIGSEESQEELDNIIPPNFADFFMFDGEQLSRFMSAQKELNFRDSIHQLLGLKQLKILKDDLERLQKRYENDLKQEESTNDEVIQKQRLIDRINRDITNYEMKIEKYEENISDHESIREKLDSKRNEYAHLPDVMFKLEELGRRKSEAEKSLTIAKTRLCSSSSKLFVTFLEHELENYIEENEESVSSLRDIAGLDEIQAKTQSIKEEILKMSEPICKVCNHKLSDTDISRLELEQKNIQDKLVLFENNRNESNSLKDENILFRNFLSSLNDIDFQRELDNLSEMLSKIESLERDINEKRKESEKEKYGSLGDINREISLIEGQISTKKSQIKLSKEKISGLQKEKAKIAKQIKILAHDDRLTAQASERIIYVSNLVGLLEEALDTSTKSKRDLILNKSNKLFMEITNKPEEYGGIDFESDDSYAFVIKTKDGKIVTNPSKGEKQILAMSFLLGLSRYTGKNSVILMDTPVASLDDVHSEGIGRALANLDNQVIFLAQPQELQGDIYKNMLPSIAKEFFVERNDYKSCFKEGGL